MDTMNKEQRSARMSLVRSKNTLKLVVRAALAKKHFEDSKITEIQLTFGWKQGIGFCAFALTLISSSAVAAPCAGFDDVDGGSPFCENVAWLKSRNITLGCSAAQYCPADGVSRLAMAAFMNRLGTLIPTTMYKQEFFGSKNLNNEVVVCETGDYAASGYDVSVRIDSDISFIPTAIGNFRVKPVASTDGGATWGTLTLTYATLLSSSAAIASGSVLGPDFTLLAGTTARFGVQLERAQGTSDVVNGTCHARVTLVRSTA